MKTSFTHIQQGCTLSHLPAQYHGPFPRNIHEVRSPRQPRSKARLRSVGYDGDDKISPSSPAHPSLVFDLVTRRDLVQQEWSNDSRSREVNALWAACLSFSTAMTHAKQLLPTPFFRQMSNFSRLQILTYLRWFAVGKRIAESCEDQWEGRGWGWGVHFIMQGKTGQYRCSKSVVMVGAETNGGQLTHGHTCKYMHSTTQHT